MTGFLTDFETDLARPFGVAPRGAATVIHTGIVSATTLTTSGNVTVPPGATYCEMYCYGGGGGGGYANNTGSSAAQGGGAGGCGKSVISVVPGTSLSLSRGTGGAGGSGNTQRAADGAGSTVTYNGLTVASATGGNGGIYNGGSDPLSGLGGAGVGNIQGYLGLAGGLGAGAAPFPYNPNGVGAAGASSSGGAATLMGAGGGGGAAGGSQGGAGAAGGAIFIFYSS